MSAPFHIIFPSTICTVSHLFTLILGAAISRRIVSNQPFSVQIARVPRPYGCHQQDQFRDFAGASIVMCWGPVGTCIAQTNWICLVFGVFNGWPISIMLFQAKGK